MIAVAGFDLFAEFKKFGDTAAAAFNKSLKDIGAWGYQIGKNTQDAFAKLKKDTTTAGTTAVKVIDKGLKDIGAWGYNLGKNTQDALAKAKTDADALGAKIAADWNKGLQDIGAWGYQVGKDWKEGTKAAQEFWTGSGWQKVIIPIAVCIGLVAVIAVAMKVKGN